MLEPKRSLGRESEGLDEYAHPGNKDLSSAFKLLYYRYPLTRYGCVTSAAPSEPDTERSCAVAQRGFDILRETTDSRYRLSMVVGRRAAQLKKGVPSTVTGKVVPGTENAVSAAMKELELGTGVRWDNNLPSALEISSAVALDQRALESAPKDYSILREDKDEDGPSTPSWGAAKRHQSF